MFTLRKILGLLSFDLIIKLANIFYNFLLNIIISFYNEHFSVFLSVLFCHCQSKTQLLSLVNLCVK